MLTSDRSEQRFAPKDYRQEGDASQVAAYPAGGNAIKPDRDVDTLRPAGTILLSKGRQLLEYFEQRLLDILRNKLGDEGQAEDIFKTIRADPSFPTSAFNAEASHEPMLSDAASEIGQQDSLRLPEPGELPPYPGAPVDAVAFFKDHWAKFLPAGLTQKELRARDPKLMKRLSNLYTGQPEALSQIIPSSFLGIDEAYLRQFGKPLPPKGTPERLAALKTAGSIRSIVKKYG